MRPQMLRRGLLVMVLAVSFTSLLTVPATVTRAQSDPAAAINKLAGDLHREDMGNGLYTAWVGGNMGKRPGYLPKNLVVGEPMPSFSLKKLGTVQSVRSESLSAPYLINVWASWCPPCRKEFPRLVRADASGDLPFPILFVNSEDTLRLANTFLKPYHVKGVVLFDTPPAYDFADQIGIQVFPSSVLVGDDGVVVAIHVGQVSEAALNFLVEIAKNPGKGSFKAPKMLMPLKPFDLKNSVTLLSGVQQYGALDDDHPYTVYKFDGKKGSVVSISMRAVIKTEDDYADPYLVLLDNKGKVIAFDDDSGAFETDIRDKLGNDLAGNDVDAFIKHFKLPANSTYTLIAARTGYEIGQNQGRYQIILIDDKAYF